MGDRVGYRRVLTVMALAAARTISPLIGALLVALFGLHSVFMVAALLLLLMAFIVSHRLPDPRATPTKACAPAGESLPTAAK
ncbi:MAG: hypothetical protein JXA10_04925 [Anaerolineae bacterium]|nr:hypothetical protein [Anaerolineae bacterium]